MLTQNRQRGRNWTRKTPLRGSVLHAILQSSRISSSPTCSRTGGRPARSPYSGDANGFFGSARPRYNCWELSSIARLSTGSCFARAVMLVPVIARSVHGEMATTATGPAFAFRRAASLMRAAVTKARPPPAESPAMARSGRNVRYPLCQTWQQIRIALVVTTAGTQAAETRSGGSGQQDGPDHLGHDGKRGSLSASADRSLNRELVPRV